MQWRNSHRKRWKLRPETQAADDSLARPKTLPYGQQSIDETDIAAVVEVLRSDWLTTGPKVGEFEERFRSFVKAREAVAVSSGTAALHAAMAALGIGPGDEVIVTPMTFSASANCIVYCGGTPVFADVDPNTLLIDPARVAERVTERTRAILAVDYAGQPCDYDALRSAAPGIPIVADACHSPGATYRTRPTGTLGELNCFSLHPVKHFTTGEGGLVTTDDPDLAQKIRIFRNHGITSSHREREETATWFYEMVELGFNYRITDIQCALGISQLEKLHGWVRRRREIAAWYDEAFNGIEGVDPLAVRDGVEHSYHLYVVRVDSSRFGQSRRQVFRRLRNSGIGVNVHYIPVHLHPFYQRKFSTTAGLCPVAEGAYEEILSLPMFPAVTVHDVEKVMRAFGETGDIC